MAQIMFLGTAGSSTVVNKQFRGSGGVVIRFEDLQFHLDPGPGTLNKAKEFGVNVHHTTAILVSNNNLINCNDINALVDAMTHSGIEQRGLLLGSKTVLQGTDERAPYLTPYYRSLVEKIIPFEKSHKVGIELAQVNALPVVHNDEHATGFTFFFPKLTLSYTGETRLSEELLQGLVGADIIILSVSSSIDDENRSCLNVQDAIKIIAHARPRLAIITHFGLEMLKADPLQQAREIQRITSVQTIAAYDGLVISTENFGVYKSPVRGF
jgi:ribonuclease BN (tRNA processing enzyme)